ncbi:Tn3 family transposase [Actinoallomurus purpureus]|uniref:Tn3 family transposase n=1 Tax=Actinoallomurus purpureus TaxID=478114 RepID=UPI003558B22D
MTTRPLQPVSRQHGQVERIRQNWEDMLRVPGSLTTGKVRAYDLLRMMTSGDRMTGLGDAFANYACRPVRAGECGPSGPARARHP